MLYGPRPRALGAPHWHFYRRFWLRFGSKLGPEPGTPPTGPRVARTAGPKKAFFRFCLNRIFEFRKTKNSQHLGAFFRGTIFFTPPPGFRGSSGAENQPHPPEFQKSLYRLEKYTLPVDPSSPAFWGTVGAEKALWTSVSGACVLSGAISAGQVAAVLLLDLQIHSPDRAISYSLSGHGSQKKTASAYFIPCHSPSARVGETTKRRALLLAATTAPCSFFS